MTERLVNIILFLIISAFFAGFLSVELQNVASLSTEQNESSIYSIIVLIFFVLSLLYTYRNRIYIIRNDTEKLKWLMLTIFGISVFFSIWTSLGNRITYFLILIPYFTFLYMYISCNIIEDKVRNIIIVSIFLILICTYVQEYTKIILLSLNEETRTNASYSILYMLPLLLCINKKWIKILCIIATIVVVISSSKRGGTLAAIIASFVYFLVEYLFIKERKFNAQILVFCIIVGVIFFYGSYYLEELTIYERLRNIEDDEGSGRIDIFKHTFSMIINGNVFRLFFGHGWNGVVNDSELQLSAHNDFLEVMYDFGIVVFYLYMSFFYFLIKKTLFLIKHKSNYASAMAVSIVLFFINSVVSHIIIYPAYMSMFTACWGYILSMERKKLSSI